VAVKGLALRERIEDLPPITFLSRFNRNKT
jgi:hypothetical protein